MIKFEEDMNNFQFSYMAYFSLFFILSFPEIGTLEQNRL